MSSNESSAVMVFVTAANGEEARRLAEMLVGSHLAACVQVLPQMESIYWWQGRVERAAEVLLIIKTHRSHFSQIEREVRSLHSYDTPEIVALPIVEGSNVYLDWLAKNLNRHSAVSSG